MLKQFKSYAKDAESRRPKIFEPPVQITENVFIGSLDSVNRAALDNLQIGNIIIAGKELKQEEHNGFNVLELPLDDSFEQELIESVLLAYKFIKSIDPSSKKKNVLIHCYSGISRSGGILIGYLMKERKLSYDKAFAFIKERYPKLFPNKNFVKQLREFESHIIVSGGRLYTRTRKMRHRATKKNISLPTVNRYRRKRVNFTR
jgi:predicted protein tyrosine phosphatase